MSFFTVIVYWQWQYPGLWVRKGT